MPTLNLYMTGTQRDTQGFPPPPPKLGRQLFYTDNVTVKTVNGHPSPTGALGQQSGFCHLVREPGIWLCQAAYVLPDIPANPPDIPATIPGGLTNQFHGLTLANFGTGPDFHSAIIGGTGIYRLARGDMDAVADRPDHLTWNVNLEY
jgi:hypothetical protein